MGATIAAREWLETLDMTGWQRQQWLKLGLILGVFCLLGLTFNPGSFALTVNDVPNPRQTENTWISDRAELLSPPVERQLNQQMSQLAARTTAELAIATVPNVPPPQEPRAFALELFNHWGIGKRDKNNGVLLFVAKDNRQVEIITGKGLTNILPNAAISTLIREQIIPPFRQGNYETGIVQGTGAIAEILKTRLASAALPAIVSQTLGIISGGLAGLGYLVIIVFKHWPLTWKVPTQGLNDQEFKFNKGDEWLNRYTLPELLARLFNPDARLGQTPRLGLVCLLLGGIGLGIALALGWQTWLLPNPDWGSWYLTTLSFLVYLVASSVSVLLPIFVQRPAGDEYFIGLVWIICFGFTGCLVLANGTFTWPWIVGIIFVLNLVGIVCWLTFCDDFRFIRRWQYISQTSGQIPQELTADELKSILTPAERQGMTMGNLSFRSWREPGLISPLSREQVYLVQATSGAMPACEQCQAYTVEKTIQTVQKTIQKHKKIKGKKKKQPVDTVVNVEQTVYTCHSCGYTKVIEPASLSLDFDDYVALRQAETSSTSYDYSSGNSSSSDYDYNRYDQTYDNTSSSDFGGGSSDGSGAGSDW